MFNRFLSLHLFRIGIVTLTFIGLLPLIVEAELSNVPLLGPGLRWRPAYDGSSNQQYEFIPVIRYLGEPWFIRTTQNLFEGGLRTALAPGLHAGVQLVYERGRESGESDFLHNHNISDVDQGVSIGAHLEWDFKIGPMPLTLLSRLRQHTDFDKGTQVDFRLSAGLFQFKGLAGGVFVQETWASAKAVNTYYGLTSAQSLASGLPPYEAGGGFLFGSLGLLWSLDLTKNWVIVSSMEARFLQGDAAGSPLTERSTNYYILGGIAYRF